VEEEERIIGQMGLILSQLRFARRALEDVERSAARYGNFAFAAAFSARERFGAPPLLNGALKVYIVNINDLAPGGGLGELLSGLLGGVGRLFGGFFGGLIGGTIAGVALPVMIGQLLAIAGRVDRILDRLGLRGGDPAAATPPAPAAAPAAAGPNLSALLPQMTEAIRALTGMFRAASGDTAGAAAVSQAPDTAAGASWLVAIQAISRALEGASRVLDGMILLIPLVIGALAMVIVRLTDIKLAIVELLQFALRNVLLLRGVVLVTIYDTIAAAARLGATVLGILATAVERILRAVFSIVAQVLDGALALIQYLAGVLQRLVNTVLPWLVDVLGAVLTRLGNLFIFRVIVHIIQMLPAVIPPLFRLFHDKALPPTEAAALSAAAATPIPDPTAPPPPTGALPTLDLTGAFTPPAGTPGLPEIVRSTGEAITTEALRIFGAAGGALERMSAALDDAARSGEASFQATLEAHLLQVRERAREAATALAPAVAAAAARPATGFETIARAYEGWLAGGGLSDLMSNLNAHFRDGPTSGPAAAGTPIGAIVSETAAGLARATVEIEELTVEIIPPGASGAAVPGPVSMAPSGQQPLDVERLMEALHYLQERGGMHDPNAPFAVA